MRNTAVVSFTVLLALIAASCRSSTTTESALVAGQLAQAEDDDRTLEEKVDTDGDGEMSQRRSRHMPERNLGLGHHLADPSAAPARRYGSGHSGIDGANVDGDGERVGVGARGGSDVDTRSNRLGTGESGDVGDPA